MSHRNKTRKGFSLIELVIVVVIIGVIAAIAIPRLSRGSAGAADSALSGNLAVLRSALDMYAAEHGGQYPQGTGEEVINQLTMYTNAAGATSATKTAEHIYGPYLRRVPPLPVGVNKGSVTLALAGEAAGSAGWIYNSATGDIRANSNDTDDQGRAYNEY